MDPEKTKNAENEIDIIIGSDTKSKSAERITDNVKNNKNKHSKQDKSYRVGNYLIKNTLGSGTFGKVKLGIYLPTQEKVAVKILEKSKMTEKDDQIRLEREFEMLAQFNHPNLIMVTEIFESDNNYYTVMDYCEGGELFNYIVKNKYLSEKESSFFYYQIISGLEYIHSLGIVHRDLKPENLLLTKDHILKIIDFGLSNYFKEGQNDLLYTPCGSPCYASPEMVTGNNYDGIMIDIWSTGIILFAMLCGYLPFEDKNNEKLFKKIAECKIEYPDYLSNNAIDLLKKIIVPNPKKRITINEIKKHPFYLKGKELFDREFTIQYLSDEQNNNDDKNKKENEKENDDKNKNEKKDIDNNNGGQIQDNNNQIQNNNNNIINGNSKSTKIINQDDQEIPRDKDEIIENKENYSNNTDNNYININNNITNKKNIDNNNDINTNLNKNVNIINNNSSNKNYISNNLSKNNINNNKNKEKEKEIIINEMNKDDNSKKLKNDKNINEKNSKKIIENINDIYNTDDKKNEFTEEITKNDEKKKHKDFFKEKIKSKDNLNIDNAINKKKSLVNSCNIITLEGINNNKTIETSNYTNPNIKDINNITNINSTDNSNNNINNKKINNLKDKNFLLIEDLNNSIDIQKIRNSNNIAQNFRSNNNIKNTKENNKVIINNENYCSNTYNTKKNKNKLKGNKVINNVLGKILKINIVEKSKEKKDKEYLTNKNIKKKTEITKKNEEDFNPKIFSTRNTYFEGESKIFEKQKLNIKSKERKTEISNSKKNKIFNQKTKFLILNPYNYHKFTMSTDIKNNHTQIDIRSKKNISKNHDINIFEINKGNKSVRQDFCPTSMKKVISGKKSGGTENLKINSSSINKNKNILYSNKLNNNDFQEYTLKTETNEVLHTDLGANSLEQNSKPKFKMNKNLFKMESKLSSKDTNKTIKNSLYKKQNTGIYSSNNLKHFKINNGIIFKNIGQNLLNEERLTSNRKRNFKRKFNNLSNNNNNNYHNSENKTKKFNKIFIQKKIYDSSNINNITSSYSSKLNNHFNFKSNFVNYSNNINNSKERKNASSKTKSLKNEKILNFSNKFPLYFIEDCTSSIDYDLKNNNNNNIYNTNTVQTIKNSNINNNNNNIAPGKYIRQIKKNNNYIHIKKRQLKPGNEKRNKSKSTTKYKKKQKSISSDEPFNLKDSKYSNNLNTMRNPFHQINKTSYINFNKKFINKHKINLKKNNINDDNNTNTSSANPLVNIRNTFISFHMYPKYYLDPKKQLSTPKIVLASPSNLKHSNKVNSNLKINSKKKFASLTSNNHMRQNTSPGIESPLKKFEINNFMNIQQNIFNNIDNQKLFYYTNTEYDENILSKNINLDTIKNMKNKILNKKYKTIYREISSNNKVNSNININVNNTKNLSNTISPTNIKKFNNKINININNIDNKNIAEYNKINTNINVINTNNNVITNSNNNISNINENTKKSKNYLTNYVTSLENESNNKKKEIKVIEPSHEFNFLKKPNLINTLEKINYNTTMTNKSGAIKYGLKNKTNKKKNNNFNLSNQ